VTALPEVLATDLTPPDIGLGGRWGVLGGRLGRGHRLDAPVAVAASPWLLGQLEFESGRVEFRELVLDVARLQQYRVAGPGREFPVACQQRPALRTGKLVERVVALEPLVGAVDRVVPAHPQVGDEPAEHGVDQHARGLAHGRYSDLSHFGVALQSNR